MKTKKSIKKVPKTTNLADVQQRRAEVAMVDYLLSSSYKYIVERNQASVASEVEVFKKWVLFFESYKLKIK